MLRQTRAHIITLTELFFLRSLFKVFPRPAHFHILPTCIRETSPFANRFKVDNSIQPLLVSSVVSISRNLTIAMDAASVLWFEARLRISATIRRETCWQKATTSQNFSLISEAGQALKTCGRRNKDKNTTHIVPSRVGEWDGHLGMLIPYKTMVTFDIVSYPFHVHLMAPWDVYTHWIASWGYVNSFAHEHPSCHPHWLPRLVWSLHLRLRNPWNCYSNPDHHCQLVHSRHHVIYALHSCWRLRRRALKALLRICGKTILPLLLFSSSDVCP